jgi:hypothetical protein
MTDFLSQLATVRPAMFGARRSQPTDELAAGGPEVYNPTFLIGPIRVDFEWDAT